MQRFVRQLRIVFYRFRFVNFKVFYAPFYAFLLVLVVAYRINVTRYRIPFCAEPVAVVFRAVVKRNTCAVRYSR